MTSHGWFLGYATSKERQIRIANTIRKLRGVTAVHLLTGPYDIMIEFDFNNMETLEDFRKLLSSLLTEGVHKIQTWFGLEHF